MIYIILIVLGLVLGSFVNALVWRLHELEGLAGKKSEQAQSRRRKLSILNGRSVCPNCNHRLAARDLVPVLSWIALKGKCRYCGKPISAQYPLVELATAGLFALSYLCWPLALSGAGLFEFIVWLVMLVGFMALVVYDLCWFLLPNKIVYPLLGLAVVQAVVLAIVHRSSAQAWAPLWGFLVIAGAFYVLFRVSDGKWIGGGDVKLGALLGLLVGGPLMGVLLLFIASCTGTVYALPLVLTGKANRRSHLPFGPYLIIAAVVTQLFGAAILKWYKQLYL